MRNGFRHKIIFLLMFFPACRCPASAADAASTAASTALQPPTAVSPHGALYRVRYQDHTGYLFGTIHIGRPEFFPLEPRAAQAFAAAGTYALEVDMRDTAALQGAVKKYGMYADNDTLDKHLSPASLSAAKAGAGACGIPFDSVAHAKSMDGRQYFRYWSRLFENQGYHSEQGVETFLLKPAERQGKVDSGPGKRRLSVVPV